MTYCLMTEDGKVRVEIQCLADNRPNNLAQLYTGVRNEKIKLIVPTIAHKVWKGARTKLFTDWEATGVGLRQINWIATEDL